MKKNFFLLLVCTNMSASIYAQQTNVQDSLALVALYNSTNGDNWDSHGNWLKGPVSTWYGIDVKDGRVTDIDLEMNNLIGTIPSELGDLSNLIQLKLGYNSLSGIIPPELGNLSNLQWLSLSGNQLTGSIPPQLETLSSLWLLDLFSNQLSGNIPAELGDLSNLQWLYVAFNQLSGSIPPELGNLSNLILLDLRGNQLSGSIPPEFENLSSMTSLLLAENRLSGSIPPQLGNLSNLIDILLFRNQLSGSIPPELGGLSLLRELSLGHNQLSGGIPPELGNLSNLDKLGLESNQLTGNIPPELGNLTANIILRDNQLSGSIPPEVTDIPALVDLSYNRFTFDGMEAFALKHFHYSPQANIPVLILADTSLYVSAGGTLSNNTYEWFKVGKSGSTTVKGDSVFHPSKDGQYYAAVTNSICTLLTLHTDTIDFSTTMPVTIINLKAQMQDKFIRINWTSVTEANVSRYEIQRSSNALDFIGIGSLIAKGNGTLQYDYVFNDLQPQQGNNYYRLKIIDQDGKISFSNIVSVNISNNAVTVIYPVPVKDLLHIQTNGDASFSLLNQSGKILLSAYIKGSGMMNVSSIVAGLYYLKNNSSGEVTKLMIVR